MNIFKSTSQHQQNLDSRTHPLARGKKLVLATSLMALSCFAFSPAWAGDYGRAKTSSASIHLTSVSIQIGPGGFHLGIRAPYYGRAYARPHVYVVPAPRIYWEHSRHHGNRHYYASPQRFNRGHGWKNHGSQGNFRGNGSRGNVGHRGGHR
jgi:hypothetical protein